MDEVETRSAVIGGDGKADSCPGIKISRSDNPRVPSLFPEDSLAVRTTSSWHHQGTDLGRRAKVASP